MKLDEQFFQSLLSAAFTIQEYNDRELSGCATALPPKSADLLNFLPNISTQQSETLEPGAGETSGVGETSDRTMEAGDGNGKHLLKSIEGDGNRAAEEEADQSDEDARTTERISEHASANVNSEPLRIVPVGASKEKVAGDVSNSTAKQLDTTDHQDHDRADHQFTEIEKEFCKTGLVTAEICDSQIDDHLLRSALEQVLHGTHATTAAIALGHQGKLICREAVGESASEVGSLIDKGSGFAGVCASTKTVQYCTNTMLDSRADAQACKKVGARAAIVVPFLHKDQLLGLIAAYSRRPYAFGVHELQALEDFVEKFAARLQITGVPSNTNGPYGTGAAKMRD